MIKKLILVLAVAAAAFAAAQEPAIAPELKKLEWTVGEWSGKIKWSFPEMPVSEETMTVKTEWEGQFLKSTSVMEMGGMKATEVAFICWNAKTGKYDSYTFTNFAPTPRIEHGTLDGDKQVFLSEPWEVMGAPMVSRATLVKKSDTEMSFVLELQTGDKWHKAAEGTFKKKTGK